MIPAKGSEPPDAVAFGRSIPSGLGINLIVSNVDRAARFQVRVFGARIEYSEEHFAMMSAVGSRWLLHSDWSYRNHEMRGVVSGLHARGAGVELRLYGVDPDRAEAAARSSEDTILAASADKPHGLRESYIVDDDGYVWVPCVPTK